MRLRLGINESLPPHVVTVHGMKTLGAQRRLGEMFASASATEEAHARTRGPPAAERAAVFARGFGLLRMPGRGSKVNGIDVARCAH